VVTLDHRRQAVDGTAVCHVETVGLVPRAARARLFTAVRWQM
jgi:hypothetical protein